MKIDLDIPFLAIHDAIICGVEGGIGYWAPAGGERDLGRATADRTNFGASSATSTTANAHPRVLAVAAILRTSAHRR